MENIVDFVENQVVIVSKDDLLKFGESREVYNYFMINGKPFVSSEHSGVTLDNQENYLVLEGAYATEFLHVDYKRMRASKHFKDFSNQPSNFIRYDKRDLNIKEGLPTIFESRYQDYNQQKNSNNNINHQYEDICNIILFDRDVYEKEKSKKLSNDNVELALVQSFLDKLDKVSYSHHLIDDAKSNNILQKAKLIDANQNTGVKLLAGDIFETFIYESFRKGPDRYSQSFFNHFIDDSSIRHENNIAQETVKHASDLVVEGKEIEPNDLSCTIKVEQTPETAALDDLKEAKTYDFADTVNNMQRIVDVNNEIYEENKNKNEAERVNPKAQFQFNIKDKDKEFSLPATTQVLGKTRLTMHDLMRGNVVKAYKWAFESIDNQFQKGLPIVVKGVEKSLNAAIKTLAVPGAVVLGSALVADSALKTTANAIKYVSENAVQPIFHKVFNKANELSKRISNGIKAFNAEMKKDFKSFDPKDCIFIRLEEKEIEKLPNLKEKMQIFNAEDQVVMIKKKDFISLNSPELLDSQMYASFKDYMQGNKMGDELKASMARQIVPQIAVNKSKGR